MSHTPEISARGGQPLTPRRPDVTAIELVGGAEPFTLTLHDYDERWPALYLEHRRRIADALRPVQTAIHHIGSTSVAGLAKTDVIEAIKARARAARADRAARG